MEHLRIFFYCSPLLICVSNAYLLAMTCSVQSSKLFMLQWKRMWWPLRGVYKSVSTDGPRPSSIFSSPSSFVKLNKNGSYISGNSLGTKHEFVSRIPSTVPSKNAMHYSYEYLCEREGHYLFYMFLFSPTLLALTVAMYVRPSVQHSRPLTD